MIDAKEALEDIARLAPLMDLETIGIRTLAAASTVAAARVTELEQHIDTATNAIEWRSHAVGEFKELYKKLNGIESIYTNNYGDPLRLHLALVEVFGVPDQETSP